MAKGNFSFSDLSKEMSKVNSLGSILTENEFSRIDEWIPTGNYLLNAQISGSLFKGVPNSRSIQFGGFPGCLPKNEFVEIYILNTSVNENRKIIDETRKS